MFVYIQRAINRFLRSWATGTERRLNPPGVLRWSGGRSMDESWRCLEDRSGSSHLPEVIEEREPFDLLGEDW